MAEAPSALLLGESEIDRVERLLRELDVGFERVHAPRSAMYLPTPRQLLVVSGPCVPRLPKLLPGEPGGPEPVRICIHSQDFLPLRQRLRALGFHYLVQTALDETSLRVLIVQLLHPASRRQSMRLPLGGEVEVRSSRMSGMARLMDLSADGCRIAGVAGLELGDKAAVLLPAALGGGTALPLHGRVMRCDPPVGETPACTVVRFDVLEDDARECLDRIVHGELIGTRVTPLVQLPHRRVQEDAAAPAERRREDRHPYAGRVEVLELPGTEEGARGRDLSLAGIRIATAGATLKTGMKLTLALYGGDGGEPTVVEAEVIRSGAEEAALVFRGVTEAQQAGILALIAKPPLVESLADGDPGERVIATRILEQGGS